MQCMEMAAAVPYHLETDDGIITSPEMIVSSFDAQRAAALRCEMAELRDVVAMQKVQLKKKTASAVRARSEITRLQAELKDMARFRDTATQERDARTLEQEKVAADLDEARKRFRNRTRTLKTKIDNQSSQIESLTAKCSALDSARFKMERLTQQSVAQRESTTQHIQMLEDALSTTERERNELVVRNESERSVSEELRKQVERAAVREAGLREMASTLAGFQQDLAVACTVIRGSSSELLIRQQAARETLRTQTTGLIELKRKYESLTLAKENSGRAATSRERSLRKELDMSRKEMQGQMIEHQQDRDSHIKAQSVMRKSLEVRFVGSCFIFLRCNAMRCESSCFCVLTCALFFVSLLPFSWYCFVISLFCFSWFCLCLLLVSFGTVHRREGES